MTPGCHLGLVRAELVFRGCRTLKDRRGHLRSLGDRLRNMGFSVAQVGPADMVQHAWLAAVIVSGSRSIVSRKLDRAAELFHGPDWELASFLRDIIGESESVPEWEDM